MDFVARFVLSGAGLPDDGGKNPASGGAGKNPP